MEGFALLALLALAVALAARPLEHDDLFWHLASGRWIAAHHAVPLSDPFSFTRHGARWVTHEWGFSLLLWTVWLAGGYAAMIALRVAIVLAIGWVLVRTLDRPEEGWPPLRTALLAVALGAVAAELILRAALLSELFLAIELLFLARYRRTGDRRWLLALAGLFLVWANVHSGVVFGLFVLGLHALEALIPAFRTREPGPLLLTLGACAALILVNPNGIDAPLYPFRLSRILFASGIQWDLGHFTADSPAHNSWLLIALVLLLAGLLPLRRIRELSFAEVVAILAFAAMTFRTPRFVFSLMIVALPAIDRLHAARPWPPRARRWTAVATLALVGLAAGIAWINRPPGLLDESVPEPAARFVLANGIRGRMFNHQNYGGYLLWRLGQPVFWDGRNDVFASLVGEVTTTPFDDIEARYGLDWMLITAREYAGLRTELESGRWGLVYWDDFRAVYLRRVPKFAPQLARLELRLFPGFGGRPGLEALAQDSTLAPAARAELDRMLAANPRNQRALYFRGYLSLLQGQVENGKRDLEAALAIRPNEQVSRLLERVP